MKSKKAKMPDVEFDDDTDDSDDDALEIFRCLRCFLYLSLSDQTVTW